MSLFIPTPAWRSYLCIALAFSLSTGAWGQSEGNPLNLAWDNGQTDVGTSAVAAPSTASGNYYFRINSRAAKVWRTRLTVTSGEAHLHIAKGQVPVPGALGTRSSTLTGSDGIILSDKNFAVGEDWHILVQASAPMNNWSLVSGDPFVSDLGILPYTDSNSDGAYTIGEASQNGGVTNRIMTPEGVAFFKVTLPQNVPAWALWMNGGSHLVGVRKNLIPVLFETAPIADRKGNGNLLLVPPYLGQSSDSYFVSVVGAPGSTFSMDSRIQQIEDIAFEGTVPNIQVTGSPYRVFRVEVPPEQLVWDMSLRQLSGDPNICVRKQTVPAESDNDALSEAVGTANDSITLVSPELTNGTWFITLFGKDPYSTDLSSGTPVIRDIGFRSTVINDQPNRSGWRYYRVPDIASQLGTLGWQMNLKDAPVGTEIAIRRSVVPGIWKKKTGGATSITSVRYSDFSSANSILQRVDHEADIWYVGVYQPNVALGNFTLTLSDPLAQSATLDHYEQTVENQIEGEWRYFRINIPEDPALLGWYVDLSDIAGTTTAKITVRRDRLPPPPSGSPLVSASTSQWLSGAGWAQTTDFTGVMKNLDGTDETGRRFLAATGAGRPLQSGTYYVGVLAGIAQPPAGVPKTVSYKLRSRGIGNGYSIPVTAINPATGSAAVSALAPRDFRFYSVNVPQTANLASLTLKLNTSAGDMLMQVRRDSLPDFFPSAFVGENGGSSAVLGGKKLTRPGSEILTILPENGLQHIAPGTYYAAVVSQGETPTTSNLGGGSSSGILTSATPAPVTDLGLLSTSTTVSAPFDLPAGEMAFYRVTIPPGTRLLEAYISDRQGNPGVSIVPGNSIPIPFPGNTSTTGNSYGWAGGQNTTPHPVLAFIHEPVAGVHTIAIRANPTASEFPNGSGTLRFRIIQDWPVLEALGATRSHTVTGQKAESWRYFTLVVPDNGSIKGIYLSLTNITSGTPRMVVMKGGSLPKTFITTSGLSSDSPTWADGAQWAQVNDYTAISGNSTGSVHTGRRFIAAYGAPMGPGTYTIGVTKDSTVNTVTNPNTPDMDYTIRVDAIGKNLDYDVKEIPQNNSDSPESIIALSERDHRFFKVTIPAGLRSWRIKLQETITSNSPSQLGDGMLTIRHNHIPAFDTGSSPGVKGGVIAKIVGQDDHWAILPDTTSGTIKEGDYYIAVTSLGRAPVTTKTGSGTCDLTLTTRGEIPVTPLSPQSLDVPVVSTYDLGPTEVSAYEFTVPTPPAGAAPYGFVVGIHRNIGISNFSLRLISPDDHGLPTPPGLGIEGFIGGRPSSFTSSETVNRLINYAPAPGTYRIIVRSSGTSYSRASGELSVNFFDPGQDIPTLDFDGGSITVTNAGNITDVLPFRVIVPDEPRWKAWGVRLTGPHSGKPSLTIRRDEPVVSASGSAVDSDLTAWPTLHQWSQVNDYTKLINDPSYTTTDKDRSQQYFVAARNRPLQPGTYYVGVNNRGTDIISARSFTIETFAFGENYTVPVSDLTQIGAAAEFTIDEPRMPVVHKITVPPSTRSWALSLATVQGDFTLRVRHAHIPDTNNSTYPDLKGGVHIQKGGDERFTLLPKNGEEFLPPGDYYISTVSEGQGSSITTKTIGTGSASAVLTNLGPITVDDLGTVGETGITRDILLAPAEVKFFTVDIPSGINNLQFRLNDRAGEAGIAVIPGTILPSPIVGSESYGVFGGNTGNTIKKDKAIVNLSNPAPGKYTIALRAGGTAPSAYSSASATLSVDIIRPVSLSFSETLNTSNSLSHTDARTLADKQKFFYRVAVPEQLDGKEILGWLVTLDQGSPIVKFYRSEADFGKTAPVTMTGRTALIVPPLLTPGSTWFIEVEGVGTTDYILRSQPVSLSAAPWSLPKQFNQLAGDTNQGESDGIGIGIELAQDFWNFYAIDVPEENLGLIRFFLEASNGNPNVYIRPGAIPTTDHRSTGLGGDSLFLHRMIGTESEAANFSAVSNKLQQPDRLQPGRWFIGVKSDPIGVVRTSSRYRLKAHSGVVTDINLNTPVPLTAQNLAGKDWRYYRVTIPRDGLPAAWLPAFTRISGNAQLYIRDSLPPFSYTPSTSATPVFNHWGTDEKNKLVTNTYQSALAPGGISFSVPPLRPGHTYYLGFYGATGGSFDVSSTASASAPHYDEALTYDTGVSTLSLPAGGRRLFRFPVPADATRIKIDTIHSAIGVRVKLEQGAPPDPSPAVTSHTQSATTLPTSFIINRPLSTTWPFVPAQDYYLLLTNTTSSPIESTVTMSGVNAITEDEDKDGIPDTWERLHYTNLTQTPSTDSDGDLSNTLQEYINGTNPKDANSALYSVTTEAPGGSSTISPQMALYQKNTPITLTALPLSGDVFRHWVSANSAVNNSALSSLTIPVTNNIAATAVFSTPLWKALDTPASQAWITTGSAPWFGQYLQSHDGKDAASSPPIPLNSLTELSSTFTGPGTLTFRWRVSSRSTSHTLSLIAPGLAVPAPISGTTMVDWTPVTVEIPAGNHTLTWRYQKGNSSPLGEDRGWVDSVTYTGFNSPEPDYETWRIGNFTQSERNDPAISGPNADPDQDGIANLLEAALASLPKTADLDVLRISEIANEGESRRIKILSATSSLGISGIRLRLQANTGLKSEEWITLAERNGTAPWVSQPGLSVDQLSTQTPRAPITFTETQPDANTTTRFYRLIAEIVPEGTQ
ncbi:MAG: hypothetical protein RLZZ505_2107 [Verrucomicrobiota bacterium]|jgi:hypothetical protein